MTINSTNIMDYIQKSSLLNGGFPPSFDGNAWIFTAALFCTLIATLTSFVQIYTIVKEMKAIPDKFKSPINIYRIQLMLMYLTVILGAGPDAVYLWTFNEVTAHTTNILLGIDRIFDSLVLIPFMAFTWLQVKCGSILKFQLIRRPSPIDLYPTKPTITGGFIAGLGILLMSVIVTILK